MMVLSLTGRCRQAPHLVRVVVSAAWVTLLYVVGLAIVWALGRHKHWSDRTGELGSGWVFNVRFGS